MGDRLLNESFETSGEWFLPEAPDRKIAGILRYTPQQTELRLHESFTPLRQGTIRFDEPPITYPAVYGTTRDGEAMTLLTVHRTGWSLKFGSGGLRHPERLISYLLLIGAHMPAEFSYREMVFRVPGLQIWLSQPIIEQTIEREDTTGTPINLYRVRGMTKETSRVPSIDSSLDWHFGWESASDEYTSIVVKVSAWTAVRPDAPQSLDWHFEQLNKVTTMLAFLAGSPMSPDCIKASIGEAHQEVYVMVALRDVKHCPYSGLHEFFMPRGEMGVDLTDVVARWFETYPKLLMPIQLANSVLASDKLWLHVEFLSLMQALEGYHRALFAGNYMDEGEYESVKKALGDAIPAELGSDHKDALRSRIRYGNQVSLRKRLAELAKAASEEIRQAVFGGDGQVPPSWIDTRNYYTHWDEELRTNVLDTQGMYNANVRLRHFLRVLYLNILGIPPGAILKSLSNRSSSSQHLMQLNARERSAEMAANSGTVVTVQGQGTNSVSEPGSKNE